MDENTESEVDDDLLDDLSDCPSDLIPFRPAERKLLKRIGIHLRNQLLSLGPESLQSAAKVIYYLDRLPWATEGLSLDVAFVSESKLGQSFVGFEISQGEFSLYTGGYQNGPDGGDSEMTTLFRVEAGGFREGSTYDFSSWLESFECQGGKLKVDDYDEGAIPSLPQVDVAKGWARLKSYWEENWDLDDQ